MTDHPIRRLVQNSACFRCAICDRPVRWVREDDTQDTFDGYWAHIDPDELAASMKRHPAGNGRPT